MKFKSYKTAPKDGKAFLAVLAGPTIDICWYDKNDGNFKDYCHKQKIGYMMAWAKLPKTDKIYDEFGCGRFNGTTWEVI